MREFDACLPTTQYVCGFQSTVIAHDIPIPNDKNIHGALHSLGNVR